MVLSFMRISPVSCSCRLQVQLCSRSTCRQLILMQKRDRSLRQKRDRSRGFSLQECFKMVGSVAASHKSSRYQRCLRQLQ